jgi:pyridoxamine 5'-phosphate oxidase
VNQAEIFAFITKNPFCALATVEGHQARVRTIMTLRADERGILFNTGKTKDLYRQIQANPDVELCYYDPGSQVQVRISGRLVVQEDAETYKLVLEKLPFLKPLVEAKGTGLLAPCLLKGGSATVWTMPTNMAPKTFIEL